jgi:hypothetical protein
VQSANLGLIVAVVVGLAACSFVANAVYDKKVAMEPYEGTAPTAFYAGMDKFLSNISWMTLVQWEAQNSGKPSEVQLQALYRKLDSLTNLDPLFKDAYLDGALILAPAHHELAQQLLDKGMKLGLAGEWKLPFYAAMIEKMNGHGDAQRAEVYLDEAVKLPNAPPYVESLRMHWKVEQMNDPQDAMDSWYQYLVGLGADRSAQRKVAIGEINDDAQQLITQCNTDLEHTTDTKARDETLARRAHAEQRIKDIQTESPTTNPAIPIHSAV